MADLIEAPRTRANERLYLVGAIVLATVLGSLIAGGIILALNYRRMGMKSHAVKAVAYSVLAQAGFIVIAVLIPDSWHVPSIVFWLPQVLGMQSTARQLQGAAIAEQNIEGSNAASYWKSAGIGVVTMVLLLGATFGVILLSDRGSPAVDPGTKLELNANEEIYYSGDATSDDAMELASSLRNLGYLGNNHPVTVLLSKQSGSATVSFVVADGAWNDKEVATMFRLIGEALAAGRLGRPLDVRLCDGLLNTKKVITMK
jgi:hypothetical protein